MARLNTAATEKPLFWIGSSKDDLLAFPEGVKNGIGAALSVAQFGGRHPRTKIWKGEGPGIFEVVEDFEGAIYVLHAFQKKSPSGIRTARKDVALIGRRLKEARADYEVRYVAQKK